MEQWYKDGKYEHIGNFEKGKMHGKWEGWYQNGKKQYEAYYSEDLKNGTDLFWYENGIKKSEGSYKKGKKDGKWTEWSEKGIILTQENYKENLVFNNFCSEAFTVPSIDWFTDTVDGGNFRAYTDSFIILPNQEKSIPLKFIGTYLSDVTSHVYI